MSHLIRSLVTFAVLTGTLGLSGCADRIPEISQQQIETLTELGGVLKTIDTEAAFQAAKPKLETLAVTMQRLNAEMNALDPSSETYRELRAQHADKLKALTADLAAQTRRIQDLGFSDKSLADFTNTLTPKLR